MGSVGECGAEQAPDGSEISVRLKTIIETQDIIIIILNTEDSVASRGENLSAALGRGSLYIVSPRVSSHVYSDVHFLVERGYFYQARGTRETFISIVNH